MCYPSLTEENGRPCGGNDNRFAYNVIEHVGYECTDTGAFCARAYTARPLCCPAPYLSLPADAADTDGPGAQAWINRGNVIEHNIFRHIRTSEARPDAADTHTIMSTLQAVYLDDLISGWLM